MEEFILEATRFNGGSKTSQFSIDTAANARNDQDEAINKAISSINGILNKTSAINYNTLVQTNRQTSELTGGDKTFDYPVNTILLVENQHFLKFIQQCNLINNIARIASNSIIIIPSEKHIDSMIEFYKKLAADNNITQPYSPKMNNVLIEKSQGLPWNNYIIRGKELQRIDYKNDIYNAFPKTSFIAFTSHDMNDHERTISPINGSRNTLNISHTYKNTKINITCEYVARQQNGVYLIRAVDDTHGLHFDEPEKKDTYKKRSGDKEAISKQPIVNKIVEMVEFYQNINKTVELMSNNILKEAKNNKDKYHTIYTPDKTANFLICLDKFKTIPSGMKIDENITLDSLCPESYDNKTIMHNIKRAYEKYPKLSSIINSNENTIESINNFIGELHKIKQKG